jgi:ABC-type polysaccharide/polyol phosphate transport system ATPase subunit
LKSVSFKINRGDRIALIGVNGSGKTSLCRCLSDVLVPSQGKIKKHGLARAVIQTDAAFYPELTGRENVRLLATFLYPELTKNQRHDLAEEVLSFSGIGPFADAAVETYSMGMRTRLSLALTTARPADLLILDEIYNHADEFFQRKVQERLKQLIEKSGAVLMVSHYENELMEFCNRGIVLQDGKIVCDTSLKIALKTYRFMNGGSYGEANV